MTNFIPTIQTICIRINTMPHGQERPDFHVAKDRDGNPIKSQKSGRFVLIPNKSKEQTNDEQSLAALLSPYRPAIPIYGPVILGVRVFMHIPNSCPRDYHGIVPKGIGRDQWFQWAARNGVVFPLRTPDFDNCLKNIKDVMTRLSYWRDDAQIVRMAGASGKYYHDQPGYEITVQWWKELQA